MRVSLTLILLLLSGCSKEPREGLLEKKWPDLKDNSIIYVIPEQGCDGCIQSSILESTKLIESDSLHYIVFTDIYSRKGLKLKVGERIYYHSKVLLDTLNVFALKTKENIYPYQIRWKDGKIQDEKTLR